MIGRNEITGPTRATFSAVGEPAPLEDGRDRAEGGADREQVPERRLDRDRDRPEDDREQDQGEPDHHDPERQQGGREPRGDVDADGGVPGDGEVGDAVPLLQRAGPVADLLRELRGGRVGLRGLGDHLHDAEVGLAVRGGQRDRLDPVERGEVAAEVVHHADRVGGADDVDGDQQRGVEPRPVGLGDQVVGDPFRGPRRGGAGVGQAEREVLGRAAPSRAAPR